MPSCTTAAPAPMPVLVPAQQVSVALENINLYHQYVILHSSRPKRILLTIAVLLFFVFCTIYPRQHRQEFASDAAVAATAATRTAFPNDGIHTSFRQQDDDGGDEVDEADLRPPAPRSKLSQALVQLLQIASVRGESRLLVMEMSWLPSSNRTSAEVGETAGVWTTAPQPLSFSKARLMQPWSTGDTSGFMAFVSRYWRGVTSLVMAPAPPSYDVAVERLFTTMSKNVENGSCHQCAKGDPPSSQKALLEHRRLYRLFLKHEKLRVPLFLYYNRLPVYVMYRYYIMFRVRQHQYLSALRLTNMPSSIYKGLRFNPLLHIREESFERHRNTLVLYLQRLYMRAMRHSDAMQLETFHFLKYLTTTIPELRALWVGQDHCRWPGVSCIVVHLPLNILIDEEHPALVKFVEEVYHVCSDMSCEERYCPPPGCHAKVHHLKQMLFTSTIPSYWMKWDRSDDTAAIEELLGASTPNGGSVFNPSGYSRDPTTSSEESGSCPRTPMSASSRRSILTELRFGYDHPELLLTDAKLLLDIDITPYVEEFVAPPIPVGTFGVSDVLPMQKELLNVITSSLPRGIRAGVQRGRSSGGDGNGSPQRREAGVLIPFQFVLLDLSRMGLEGYLPDYLDTVSLYDNDDFNITDPSLNRGRQFCSRCASQSDSGDSSGSPNSGKNEYSAGKTSTPRRPKINTPRDDAYWGRRSRERFFAARKTRHKQMAQMVPIEELRQEVYAALQRVERQGLRWGHHDLEAYFSEIASIGRYPMDEGDIYFWPSAMLDVAREPLRADHVYPLSSDNNFGQLPNPILNIDHTITTFGEINPRLVSLLSLDISENPMLSHNFPTTWLSLPFLRIINTVNTSIRYGTRRPFETTAARQRHAETVRDDDLPGIATVCDARGAPIDLNFTGWLGF